MITVTIEELAKSIGTTKFEFLLGGFLDHFKRSDRKYHLVEEEPKFIIGHNEEMCFLAGAVHKLCNDNGLECPKWIFKEKYYLDHRVYVYDANNEEYRRYLRETSPLEFSCRNYFVPDNTLHRV